MSRLWHKKHQQKLIGAPEVKIEQEIVVGIKVNDKNRSRNESWKHKKRRESLPELCCQSVPSCNIQSKTSLTRRYSTPWPLPDGALEFVTSPHLKSTLYIGKLVQTSVIAPDDKLRLGLNATVRTTVLPFWRGSHASWSQKKPPKTVGPWATARPRPGSGWGWGWRRWVAPVGIDRGGVCVVEGGHLDSDVCVSCWCSACQFANKNELLRVSRERKQRLDGKSRNCPLVNLSTAAPDLPWRQVEFPYYYPVATDVQSGVAWEVKMILGSLVHKPRLLNCCAVLYLHGHSIKILPQLY